MCRHISILVKCYTIHTYKCLCLVLLCQCSVWILFTCYVVAVCHPCHTLHHITTLSSLSLYTTPHSACLTCYMYVHMHHANVLHMLLSVLTMHRAYIHVLCLCTTPTCACTCTCIHTAYIVCLWSTMCHCLFVVTQQKMAPWCKRFACSQTVKRCVRRFNSYHRSSVSHSEIEAGSEDEVLLSYQAV